MSIVLSVCIPTYNRAEYLRYNVDKLITLIRGIGPDQVEICVSNNDSTDHTEELIKNYISNNPDIRIVYHKNETNLGADWNFHHAMNMASGEYTILLGDDDYFADNALKRIFELINSGIEFDMLLYNKSLVSVDLKPIKKTSYLREDIGSQVFDFSNPLVEKYYYSLCRSLGGVFSFISSLVYKTEAIRLIEFDESFIGCIYSFLGYTFPYLKNGRKLFFLNEYLINCRYGLPGFGDGYKRILLDLNGYSFLKEKLFVNDDAGIEFISILKHEWPLHHLLQAYCYMDSDEWNLRFRPLLLNIGWAEHDILFIEKIGNTPNLYQSKFKQKLKKLFFK
jgi:abequosyltransferase